MKLELVSHPICPFVHRAAIMLAEKGVPFERRYVDLKAKPDWFLAISPRGKVPLLVADGSVLFESAAICLQLADLHLWRLGPGHLGAIISVVTMQAREAEFYRARLARFRSLSHLTVEVLHKS